MTKRGTIILIGIVAVVAAATVIFISQHHYSRKQAPPAPGAILSDADAFAAYAGSAACRDCHSAAYDKWIASNHGLAERPLDDAHDRAAFDPARSFKHGTQATEARLADNRYEVTTTGLSGKPETIVAVRVIGHDPLRQFIVPAERGREQVLEASYDPHRNEWFNVYGKEDRKPGEWGHWTGRGMTWNTMCASCHNTRLRKNYVEAADSFHTAMAEMTVGCEACHGPMKAHVEWRAEHPDTTRDPHDPTLVKFSPDQWLSTCGSCHSRRTELTGDFVPGDAFTDHYALTVPDHSNTYYPDGQVHEEDYEYAAFLGSRMHKAGIRCGDCHDPHAAKPKMAGDVLCMSCHNGTRQDAPVIVPATHTFHKPESTGSSCIGCHMPITTYMQRHPRHDHGFTVPDPLLTIEHGIPNACNRCHTDKDARWAWSATEKWYGAKMSRPSRERARTVAAARADDPNARERVLALLATDSTAYWKAVACQLLGAWGTDPGAVEALTIAARDPSPMVRASAARSLEAAAADVAHPARGVVGSLCEDPDRSVRVAAAWALRSSIEARSSAWKDLMRTLDQNADHVTGQMQRGVWFAARGEPVAAADAYKRALSWDHNSAPIHRDYAVVLAQLGRNADARAQLEAAVRLEPNEPEYRYVLALSYAEAGELKRAQTELERVTRERPHDAHAWYNLGLALNQQGDAEGAIAALRQAERADPRDPRAPYARATIHMQRGEIAEARGAAQRALELDPNSEETQRLVAALSRIN